MIINSDIDCWHWTAKLRGDCVVSCNIDYRCKNTAMCVASVRIDHPFLAPGRFDFDAIGIRFEDCEIEPSIKRPARDQLLEFFLSYCRFSHHLLRLVCG